MATLDRRVQVLMPDEATVFLYAIGQPSPFKHSCADILRAIAGREIQSATSVEVLQEILHVYTRRNRRADAIAVARSLAEQVTQLLPITPAVFAHALTVHDRFPQLTAKDSLHTATLYHFGLPHIVTADRHFDNLPGIVRIDPLDWRNR